MSANLAPTHNAPPAVEGRSRLEEFERSNDDKPAFVLTYTEVKLLGIAGVSFWFA